MLSEKVKAETEIKELMNKWLEAIRTKDVEKIMSCYANDCIMYDAIPPLQYKGKEEYQKNWEMCFEMFPESIGFDFADIHIFANDDLAYCFNLSNMRGHTKDNEDIDFWFRATSCYRKINGKWLVVHEHVSAPFDPESEKALLRLKP